jgi:multicomponent Na+:H+ antiporter subunit F
VIGVNIAIIIVTLACISTAYRMVYGPTDADRAIASDLLLFGVTGLIALFGVRASFDYTFDIVLLASIVGFIGALSLARALTRGKR